MTLRKNVTKRIFYTQSPTIANLRQTSAIHANHKARPSQKRPEWIVPRLCQSGGVGLGCNPAFVLIGMRGVFSTMGRINETLPHCINHHLKSL